MTKHLQIADCHTQNNEVKAPYTIQWAHKSPKIIVLLVLGVLLASLAIALNGCGDSGTNTNTTATSNTAEQANPIVEVKDVAEVNQKLSIHLVVPEEAAVESCSIIADELGQVTFELNGRIFNHRGKVTNEDEDISGLYYDFTSKENGEISQVAYAIEFNEGELGTAKWRDVSSGITYSVSVGSGANSIMLREMVAELIDLQLNTAG